MTEISRPVRDYLAGVTPARRRADAERLLELMARATGETPYVERGAIGFGRYRYRYASGREGDAAAAGFAARKAATIVYLLDGTGRYGDRLARLGSHTAGVGSIQIKDLGAVDLDVLESIVAESFGRLTAGTYTLRAREGTPD